MLSCLVLLSLNLVLAAPEAPSSAAAIPAPAASAAAAQPVATPKPAATPAAAGRSNDKKPVNPCDGAVQEFCPDAIVADGSAVRCLSQNEAKLTPACKDMVAFRKKRFQTTTKKCTDALMEYCGDVKGSLSAIDACMMKNTYKFPVDCRKKDAKMIIERNKPAPPKPGAKKLAKPTVIPKSLPADPEIVKPPPPPAPKPPPEGMMIDPATGKVVRVTKPATKAAPSADTAKPAPKNPSAGSTAPVVTPTPAAPAATPAATPAH